MLLKFCQYLKPISISLSPNTEKDDVLLAFKLLFQPWRWKYTTFATIVENVVYQLEEEFKKYLEVKYATSFNSGRSALMAILSSLELTKGEEVLLQAFTCNAAANPIIWSGLKPIYVDCDEKTFNIDVEDLKKKISPRSRVVMVQHTFGLPAFTEASAGQPAERDEILKICKENNLILIEDCAHSLGADFQGKKIGTFGKAAFFSFGRDKVISSVYGGMVITNDDDLAKKLKEYQEEISYPSYFWIKQQLLHPILMNWLILPTYQILGKYLLVLFQWLQILTKAVHWKEKIGEKPNYFPKRLPNALAILALNQFKKLRRFNEHRQKIADFYYNELKELSSFELPQTLNDKGHIFLRFTIKHPKAHEIIKKAWQKNILIGDWYTDPLAPYGTRLDKLQYKLGSCSKAEKLSRETLNLPTHINISQKEAQKIVNFLKIFSP